MKDSHPFVGRKAELKQFSELLADPAGKAILVSGSAAMGKSMLLKEMAQSVQAHPTLKCTCLYYQITSSDGVDSTMLEIVNDAADAVQSLSGKLKSTANANKEKLSALFSAVEAIPMVGQSIGKLGNLVLSLAEQARHGNARQQLKQILRLLSEKLPNNGRMLFFIDPEKLMPDGSADAWRLVVDGLPDKILFVFAQRPEDILISDAYFPKLGNVYRVPQDTLEVLSPEDVDTLIESRKSDIPSDLSEKEIRACLDRYHGHPFSIQAALDLLVEGVRLEDLPNKAKPVEFAHIIIQTIERKGNTEALSFLEAAAIIEVPAAKEMITEVAQLSEKQARVLLADRFIGGLFRQEAKGVRIYHIILADEILKRIGDKEKKEYHGLAAVYYRRMLQVAKPIEIAVVRLPEHVREAEGELSFAKCFVEECTSFLLRFGLYDLFILYSKDSLAVIEQGTVSHAVILGNLGTVYRIRGELDMAKNVIYKALEIFERLKYEEGIANQYSNLSSIFLTRSQLDKAEEMLLKALEINERLNRFEEMATQYGSLGLIYQTRRCLDKAEEMLCKALEIYKQYERFDGIANTYGNLGLVYQTRGWLDKAEKMYRESLKINEQEGYKGGISGNYISLGVIYAMRDQLDQAEQMFEKSLEIETQLGRLEGMADIYGNLGNIYLSHGDLDKADEMYRKVVNIEKQLNRQESIAITYYNLGLVSHKRGQSSEVKQYWQQARKLYEQIGAKEQAEEMQRRIEGIEEK